MTCVLALVTPHRGMQHAGIGAAGIPATYTFAMTAGDAIVALDERGTVIGTIWYWIREGVAGTAMPPWRDRLSEADMWRLVHYLRALARGEP